MSLIEIIDKFIQIIKESFTPIAAIVGAGAWIPHVYSKFKKAEVTLIHSSYITLGFTANGPTLELNLGFSTQNKDIIITAINITIEHVDDSEIKKYVWTKITQKYATSTLPGVAQMQNERAHDILAIKISQHLLEEKTILFQSIDFTKICEEKTFNAQKKLSHLINKQKRFEFKDSMEFEDLCSATEQAFNWKSGEYKLHLTLESSDDKNFSLFNNSYKFILKPEGVDALSQNKPLIRQFYENYNYEKEEDRIILNWIPLSTKLYKANE